MKSIRTALLLLASVLAAGCSEEPTGSETEARFTATIDGVVEAKLEGRAIFGASSDENGLPVFAVILGEDTDRHRLAFTRAGTLPPKVGSYEFADVNTEGNPWKGVFVVLEAGELAATFVATSGSVKIMESRAGRLRGTFRFTAEGYLHSDDAASVVIEAVGQFDAGPATAEPNLRPRS